MNKKTDATFTDIDRANENFYRLCFDHSTDIIFILDTDLNIKKISPAVEAISGYKPEELLGKTYFDLGIINTENVGSLARDKKVLFSGKSIKNKVYKFRDKSDNIHFAEVNATPIIEDGIVVACVASARDITERKRVEKQYQDTLERLRTSLDLMIHSLSLTVESRDPYTAGHQRRVADLARAIGTQMGLSEDTRDCIRMSGIVHDLGKVSIPSEILSKPGILHEHEMGIIKHHPLTGYEILKDIDFPWPVADIVLQHHERIDGSGYPHGLTKDEIHLESRIISVADVVEAMASHRPYRASIGIDYAIIEIKEGKGTIYDEEVVDACVALFEEGDYKFE
ncbi:MAG: HD domain-containing protein [Bacteroidales bacterium]|nr:HD domain-containing protein [Bacteroidales bacterium]